MQAAQPVFFAPGKGYGKSKGGKRASSCAAHLAVDPRQFLGKGGGKGGKGGVPLHTRTETTTVSYVQQGDARPKFDVVVVLDVSGSMVGRKLQDAKACIKEVVDEVLAVDDGFALVLFDTQVRVALQLTRKRHMQDHLASVFQSVQAGSQTALWDAVLQGFELLCNRDRQRPPYPSYPYLIVLTDGHDNASRSITKNHLQAIMEKPGSHGYGGNKARGFHLNFITVGGDADRAGAESFCSRPHLKSFHAATADDLLPTFRMVKRALQKVITTTTVTETHMGQPATPQPRSSSVGGYGGSYPSSAAHAHKRHTQAAAGPAPAPFGGGGRSTTPRHSHFGYGQPTTPPYSHVGHGWPTTPPRGILHGGCGRPTTPPRGHVGNGRSATPPRGSLHSGYRRSTTPPRCPPPGLTATKPRASSAAGVHRVPIFSFGNPQGA